MPKRSGKRRTERDDASRRTGKTQGMRACLGCGRAFKPGPGFTAHTKACIPAPAVEKLNAKRRVYIPVVVDHRSEKGRHPRQLKPLSCTNTDAARKAVSATKAVSSMGALVAIGHTVPKGDGISPKRLKTETVAGASAFSVRGSGAGRVLAGMQHPHHKSPRPRKPEQEQVMAPEQEQVMACRARGTIHPVWAGAAYERQGGRNPNAGNEHSQYLVKKFDRDIKQAGRSLQAVRQYVSFDSDGRDRGQPFDIPARLPVQHIRKLTGVEPKLLGRRHMARPAQNGKVFQCLVKGMGAKSSVWPQAKLSNLVMRYPAREASGIQADWHTEKLTYRAPPVFHPEHDKQVTHCLQSITKMLLPSELDHVANPVIHENGLGLFNRRKIDTSTKAVHRPLRSIGAVNEVIAYTNRLAVSSITPIMAPPINHFGRQQSCTDHEQYDKVLAYINEPRRQPFDPVDLTNEDVNEIVNGEEVHGLAVVEAAHLLLLPRNGFGEVALCRIPAVDALVWQPTHVAEIGLGLDGQDRQRARVVAEDDELGAEGACLAHLLGTPLPFHIAMISMSRGLPAAAPVRMSANSKR